MRVYLDEDHKAPQGWVQVRWAKDATDLLQTGLVTELSLTCVLGEGKGSGLSVLSWIEDQVKRGVKPPLIFAHAEDPEDKRKLEQAIISIYRLAGKRGSVMWTLRAKALQWKGQSSRKGV